MPDNADQEPSIEEILASIRQIISDDDGPSIVAPVAAPPAAAPSPQPPPSPPPKPDILELSEVIEEPRMAPPPPPAAPPPPPPVEVPRHVPMEIDLLDIEEEPAPEPEPEAPASKPFEEPILGARAADATLQGFARLTSQMALDRSGSGGTTIEDIVRDLLKPMLKTWLDSNLPPLIEKLVQKELDRISRRAAD